MAIAFCVHHTGDVSGLIGPEKKQNAIAGGQRAAPSQARGRGEALRREDPGLARPHLLGPMLWGAAGPGVLGAAGPGAAPFTKQVLVLPSR